MASDQGFGFDWHPDITLNVDDQCLVSWLEPECLNHHRQQEPAYAPIPSMDARAHTGLPPDSMRVLENLQMPNEPQHASLADSDLSPSSSPRLDYGGHVQRSLHELSHSSGASTVTPGSSFMIHEYPEGDSASQSPTPRGGRPNRRQKKQAM